MSEVTGRSASKRTHERLAEFANASTLADRISNEDLGFAQQHMGADPVGSARLSGKLLADPRPFTKVCDDDLQQIVIVAADVRGFDNLRDCGHRSIEPGQFLGAVRLQRDFGEEHDAHVQHERVEARMIALDHARALELPDAGETRAR